MGVGGGCCNTNCNKLHSAIPLTGTTYLLFCFKLKQAGQKETIDVSLQLKSDFYFLRHFTLFINMASFVFGVNAYNFLINFCVFITINDNAKQP